MFRRVFTALAALSLLLCVGVTLLWVRGHSVGDTLGYAWGDDHVACAKSAAGRLAVTRTQTTGRSWRPDLPRQQGWRYEQFRPPRTHVQDLPNEMDFGHMEHLRNRVAVYSFGGAAAWSYDVSVPMTDGRIKERGVEVPSWLAALLCLLLPARWALVRQREAKPRSRHGQGLCRSCGYDLRATPGGCPECGTAPAPREA